MFNKILIIKKISTQQFYYNGQSASSGIIEADAEQENNFLLIKKILDDKRKDYRIVSRKELTNEKVSDYDLIISAGGDGTVIATAAYNMIIPQLNLRLDKKSKGALCQHNIEEALKKTFENKYSLENWTRQDVFLEGKMIGCTLNDVCVGEGKDGLDFSKMAVYELEFVDREGQIQKDIHKNSGLVVVTGNGSSAWGKNFNSYSRQSNLFSFITVLPNEGKINSGVGNYFKLIYKHHEGKLALDTITHNFPRDSVLEIKLSEHPLKVVVPELK